jgi:hypothetical protein
LEWRSGEGGRYEEIDGIEELNGGLRGVARFLSFSFGFGSEDLMAASVGQHYVNCKDSMVWCWE